MEKGMDFLKSQVNNAVMQHQSLLDSLDDHAGQAEDARFKALCTKWLPRMKQHQAQLESYAKEIGAESSAGKKVLGKAMGLAKDLADAGRQSDFLRLVSDIVMARQSEDTFKTFREAGKTLGNQRLQTIGEHGEREHDEYVKEANALVQQLFVEHVRGTTAGAAASTTARSGAEQPRPSM